MRPSLAYFLFYSSMKSHCYDAQNLVYNTIIIVSMTESRFLLLSTNNHDSTQVGDCLIQKRQITHG